MKKVSVIVPIYNTEVYLDECLSSIANQTYENIEVILVNDGSTDDSINVLRKYIKDDDRFSLINIQNSGVSIARNMALDIASGDYITFVDSDDYLDKDAIEMMVKMAEENNADIVRTTYKTDYIQKHVDNKFIGLYEDKDLNKFTKYIVGSLFPTYLWVYLIDSKLIKKNRFHEDIYMMEDMVFLYEVTKNAKRIYVSDVATYNFRIVNTSIVNARKNVIRNIESIIKVSEYFQRENLDRISFMYNSLCIFKVLSKYITGADEKTFSQISELLGSNDTFDTIKRSINYLELCNVNKVIYQYFAKGVNYKTFMALIDEARNKDKK